MEIDVKLINEMIITFNKWSQKVKIITIKASSKNNAEIDATNLASGIYYLNVEKIVFTKPIKFLKIC